MRHPTDGTLRRLLDEPAGVAAADREHIAGCPVCLTGLAAAQQDAAAAGAALYVEVTPDVEAGWQRLSGAVAGEKGRAVATETRPVAAKKGRWRAALRSPVIAVVGVLALVTGAGAAAATDWLQIFHTERIAPVTIRQADLVALPDLSAYGDLKLAAAPNIRRAADAAAATKATGIPAPRVAELPRGVTGEPAFQIGDRASAVFTFSTQKAAQAAAAAGHTLPPTPSGLDGSRFQLSAGPGLAAVWTKGQGVPSLIVARAVAPTAYSTGIPFTTARDYLLSLSGLPEDVAAQLRSFTGDGTTLPVHVMAEELTSSPADVGGRPATVLALKDGTMAAVVWVEDGQVTAVAGSLSVDEVLSVARDLKWQR